MGAAKEAGGKAAGGGEGARVEEGQWQRRDDGRGGTMAEEGCGRRTGAGEGGRAWRGDPAGCREEECRQWEGVNGSLKCSDFGNFECSVFGSNTTVDSATMVQ